MWSGAWEVFPRQLEQLRVVAVVMVMGVLAGRQGWRAFSKLQLMVGIIII